MTSIRTRQAQRMNPRFIWASQKPAPGIDNSGRASVVTIEPLPAVGERVPGQPQVWDTSRATIAQNAAITLDRIKRQLGTGVGHVILDEVRTNTSPVARELFAHLPPEMRGKLAAYVVGGRGVTYEGNPTFQGIWSGMRRNQVEALPEVYEGNRLKQADMADAAQAARDKVAWLRQQGIASSPAVSPLSKYHNPGYRAGVPQTVAQNQAGNLHASQWMAALRAAMPNQPFSIWATGGTGPGGVPAGRHMLADLLRPTTP